MKEKEEGRRPEGERSVGRKKRMLMRNDERGRTQEEKEERSLLLFEREERTLVSRIKAIKALFSGSQCHASPWWGPWLEWWGPGLMSEEQGPEAALGGGMGAAWLSLSRKEGSASSSGPDTGQWWLAYSQVWGMSWGNERMCPRELQLQHYHIVSARMQSWEPPNRENPRPATDLPRSSSTSCL